MEIYRIIANDSHISTIRHPAAHLMLTPTFLHNFLIQVFSISRTTCISKHPRYSVQRDVCGPIAISLKYRRHVSAWTWYLNWEKAFENGESEIQMSANCIFVCCFHLRFIRLYTGESYTDLLLNGYNMRTMPIVLISHTALENFSLKQVAEYVLLNAIGNSIHSGEPPIFCV